MHVRLAFVVAAHFASAQASRVVEVVTTTSSDSRANNDWLTWLWVVLLILVMLSILGCVLSPYFGGAAQPDDQPVVVYAGPQPREAVLEEPKRRGTFGRLSTRLIGVRR